MYILYIYILCIIYDILYVYNVYIHYTTYEAKYLTCLFFDELVKNWAKITKILQTREKFTKIRQHRHFILLGCSALTQSSL